MATRFNFLADEQATLFHRSPLAALGRAALRRLLGVKLIVMLLSFPPEVNRARLFLQILSYPWSFITSAPLLVT